jgi:large subunit ribosomal protein L3
MPGLMGNAQVTVQNLEVVAVRPEDNVLLIKGAIPGARGGVVVVRKAVQNFVGATAPAQAAA